MKMNGTAFPKLKIDLDLTSLEWEILKHRLDVPDAIADAIEGYHPDDVEAVCGELLSGGLKLACSINEGLTFAVLADAVEGSTYYGAGLSVESDQKLAAVLRAGNRLAEKIGKLIGRELDYPNY